MKQFITWFGKRVANALVTALFFVLAVGGITYAVSFPGIAPDGTTNTGGKFANLFNNILQSGNYTTDTTGKVKLATLADNSHTTDQIGTLTAGKWCKVVGGKIECTSDAPSSALVAPIGTSLYGGIAWQTTDTGPVTYSDAANYCNSLAPIGTWRVPTSSEINYARVLGMTFTANRWFWSSTPNPNDGTYYYGDYYYAYLESKNWSQCNSPGSVYCNYNNSAIGYH